VELLLVNSSEAATGVPSRSRLTRLKPFRQGVKLLLGGVVIIAAGRHVLQTWTGLQSQGIFIQFEIGWLILAALAYQVGLVLDGVWFGRILQHTATPIARLAAIRAYLISHLGKYVPGKALVVIMRVALVVPAGARAATAAFATLYETLVMMAAGGLVACLGFLVEPGSRGTVPWLGEVPLAILAILPACGFLVLTYPPVFERLTRLISVPFPGVGPDVWPAIPARLQLEGLAWTALGWLFLGASQIAVLYGVGYRDLSPEMFPAVIGSVALATVAGFVVPISPGGLGVREWVLWTSLGATLDHGWAVVASLTLRLVWIGAELVGSAMLAPLGANRLRNRPVNAPSIHDLSSSVQAELQ